MVPLCPHLSFRRSRGQREVERRSLARLGFEPYLTVVVLDDLLYDGKADAGLINDASFKVGLDDIEKSNQSKDEADVTTGWHAIEFLLWGQDLSADGPGNRPYTDYVAGAGNNDRRREYLKLVTDDLAHKLNELEGAWQLQNALGYAKKLKAMPEREVIGRMMNGMAILAGFEFMSERLAVALDSGDQEDEHSCFSDTTKQDFVYDLAGIKQVWTGDNEGGERPGLNDLVRSQDAALADRVDGLLADAETKVAALGDHACADLRAVDAHRVVGLVADVGVARRLPLCHI